MPDLLDDIRQEISTRLAELRPLVDEHARLQAAMYALGEIPKRAAVVRPASSPGQPKTRVQKTPAVRARKRAPRGANREAVLRAARERPGATAAELAEFSKVDRNTLNVLLTRLVQAGELQKRPLPTGRAGYVLSNARSAEASAAEEQVVVVRSAEAT